jgi:hypothetical protein
MNTNLESTINQAVQEGAASISPTELNIEQVICFDDIKPNSLLVIRISDFNDAKNFMLALQTIKKQYADILKDKNILFTILGKKDKIEMLDEKQMNNLGWYKRGLIIPAK